MCYPGREGELWCGGFYISPALPSAAADRRIRGSGSPFVSGGGNKTAMKKIKEFISSLDFQCRASRTGDARC